MTLPGEGTSSLDGTGATGQQRIIDRHIYENRQNTTNVSVPKGYRTVWEDGRLNPKRAERTLAPAQIKSAEVPGGFQPAWDDGRLNKQRGRVTARGDAATDQIWERKLPRQLARQPLDRPVVTVSSKSQPKARAATATVSTKSAPATKPSYVRVAAFADKAQAKAAAQALVRTGMPVRLGTGKRGGKSTPLVLAGPFSSDKSARAALRQVKGAGYSSARLLR